MYFCREACQRRLGVWKHKKRPTYNDAASFAQLPARSAANRRRALLMSPPPTVARGRLRTRLRGAVGCRDPRLTYTLYYQETKWAVISVWAVYWQRNPNIWVNFCSPHRAASGLAMCESTIDSSLVCFSPDNLYEGIIMGVPLGMRYRPGSPVEAIE